MTFTVRYIVIARNATASIMTIYTLSEWSSGTSIAFPKNAVPIRAAARRSDITLISIMRSTSLAFRPLRFMSRYFFSPSSVRLPRRTSFLIFIFAFFQCFSKNS